MSNEITRPKGKVVLVAAGGAGTNIARSLLSHTKESVTGFADLSIHLADTSTSNIANIPDLDENIIHLIEDKDGSGQKRSLNYADIAPRIKNIAQSLPEANIYVVLHSLSGGSGSVIGPLLVNELHQRDKDVLVIGIGDSSSKIFADNTLKTIKSYESISSKNEFPIPMGYFHNGKGISDKEINAHITSLVSSIRVLYSNSNTGLDGQDLHHWLRYNKVVDGVDAKLVSLTVETPDNHDTSKLKELSKSRGNPVTVASLYVDDDKTPYKFPEVVDYCTVGSTSKEVLNVFGTGVCHYVIRDGLFPELVKDIDKFINDLTMARNSKVARGNILTDKDKDKATDEGIIF